MRSLVMLIKRNILIFVKDKASVFFSLLSMLIIIGLNAVFLNKTNVDGILEIILIDRDKAGILVNSMVMAEIIVVNATTVTLGYILSSFIMGCVFCFITFFISEVYIYLSGGYLLTFGKMIKVIFFIMVNVFSASCFVFLITSLIHSSRAFSSISIIIGTLVGFIGGLYIPLGELPELVQKIVKCCPIIYGTSLMKGVFVENLLTDVFSNIDTSALDSYKEYMAISISINNNIVSDIQKIGILIGSGVLFAILSVIIIKNKRVKDR